MQLVNTIHVGSGRVELLYGDLSAIQDSFAVDLLIVSAFPGDYTPTATSLIGALARRGVSVAGLAADMAEDLREQCACWLSGRIDPERGVGFGQLLCFEPQLWGAPPEVVGDVFQALVPVLGRDASIRSVAMPILSSGDQGYKVAQTLPPLLDAAIQWLKAGLPLETIRIVAHTEADLLEAREAFDGAALEFAKEGSFLKPGSAPGTKPAFDLFISYSHSDAAAALALESELRERRPDIKIFLDRKALRVGVAWQIEIFESLDQCRRVAALLSPSYITSKMCKEEFNIAWVRGREADEEVLFPIYLFSAELPSYMKYRQYLDCREADAARIAEAAAELLLALDASCQG